MHCGLGEGICARGATSLKSWLDARLRARGRRISFSLWLWKVQIARRKRCCSRSMDSWGPCRAPLAWGSAGRNGTQAEKNSPRRESFHFASAEIMEDEVHPQEKWRLQTVLRAGQMYQHLKGAGLLNKLIEG